MSKRLLAVLAGVAGIGLITPAAAQLANPAEASARWVDAFNRRDHVALARLYAPDAVAVNITGMSARGRSDIEASLQRSFAALPQRTLRVVSSNVRDYGDVSVVEDQVELTQVVASRRVVIVGRASIVLRKTPEGWYIIDHHSSGAPHP